ncbi:FixH family protein [Belliella sp. DSM 111904]|uniref:FixH family protein n=1 Tax=Belliella filtrata TaxID=2923435 RepID=A0ABS9UYM4_9BACT|nr:FixH family protein [Belliella filtrata]MCH7409219.1 FixH family protein [Belliella filtrata]
MDWGKGIVIVIAAFVVFMIGLVTICMKQDDIHLVTQQYYEEEIKYQEQIDKISNAKSLEYKVLDYNAKLKALSLNVPESAIGTIHFFRPSDARLDSKLNFQEIKTEDGLVDLAMLMPGYWRVKVSWENEGVLYYDEIKIDI